MKRKSTLPGGVKRNWVMALLVLPFLLIIIYMLWAIASSGIDPVPPSEEDMVAGKALALCGSIYEYHRIIGVFPAIDSTLGEQLRGDNPIRRTFVLPDRIPTEVNGRFMDQSGKPYTVAITTKEMQVHDSNGDIVASMDSNTGFPMASNSIEQRLANK
jgi:hypothetical protein